MLSIQNITKKFQLKKTEILALDNVCLNIEKGDFVLIKGHSGCGKSTLLFTLGGMLRPDKGSVILGGKDVYAMAAKDLLYYRARKIGFVYQSYHLIPYLSVIENIMLVNKSGGTITDRGKVAEMAKTFNLYDRLEHKPSELSIGEKQRAALLRALAVNPDILIADEPTGNLDKENSEIIMQHFVNFQKSGGTVVMASHGYEADRIATVSVGMNNGKIVKL